MVAVSIEAFDGDVVALSDLIIRTWRRNFDGRQWFPLWDGDYLGWRIGDPRNADPALVICAREGGRLVGCIVSEPAQLRVRAHHVAGSLTSYLSVDPECKVRGLALSLAEASRRAHRERGLRLSLGVTIAGPGSISKAFWEGLRRRRPAELHFLRRIQMWTAVIDGRAIAAAGLTRWERLNARLGAWVPWGWGIWRAAPARPFVPVDLDWCLALSKAPDKADISTCWSRERLSLQLDHPYVRTLVTPDGFANGYLITWSGVHDVRVGVIELCLSTAGIAGQARLLVALGQLFAAEGAAMVVLLDQGAAPRPALWRAGFAPVDSAIDSMALFADPDLAVGPGMRVQAPFT